MADHEATPMPRCTTHFHACDCREALFEKIRNRGEDLERELAAANSELETLRAKDMRFSQREPTALRYQLKEAQEQLAASQAREQGLREALKECLDDSRQVLSDYQQMYGPNYKQHRITAQLEVVAKAESALSAPTDTAALDAVLEKSKSFQLIASARINIQWVGDYPAVFAFSTLSGSDGVKSEYNGNTGKTDSQALIEAVGCAGAIRAMG